MGSPLRFLILDLFRYGKSTGVSRQIPEKSARNASTQSFTPILISVSDSSTLAVFMQTEPPSEREVDLALRRYDAVLRYLAVVQQMTWRKTQFFLALNLGLLTLAGALGKVSFIGTGWIASHALRIIAGTGLTASVLWGVALRQNAREVDRCIEVCRSLEPVAMEQHEVLQAVPKRRVLSTHGILALLFSFIWLAVIKTQLTH